ncbi:hypothetical protein [Mucilaginibacter defluvii]|uniref:Uncharacterized protein n=1 Tax=Mucilaginibacter defluvii TaxID=1196019 RepID=A0ABP9G6B3_9SPHI
MNAQIIKNQSGVPVSVVLDYKDWLEIEQKLKLEPSESTENSLDWYGLTETTNAILNELIAYTIREEFKESQKPFPDQLHLQKINLLLHEVQAINKEPENFKSLGRMQEIINKYAPILREIDAAA